MTYYEIIAGMSTTNVVFIILFLGLNYLRKRLNRSNCQSHCYFFDCEAQLMDLEHVKAEVNTQRGMLQNVIDMLETSKGNSV